MTYRVEVARTAERDLRAAHRWIAKRAPEAADRWLEGLAAAFDSLAQHPGRCPLAAESAAFRTEIRQLLYGSYRLLFTIRGRKVLVLHVRHAARRPLGGD